MLTLSSKYWLIVPVALLVAFSQFLVKWRSASVGHLATGDALGGFSRFIADPVVLFAYALAFLASLGWLFVVTKLPLSVAFPVYMATTFLFTLVAGWLFLGESLSTMKVVAVMMILAGIVLAVRADA